MRNITLNPDIFQSETDILLKGVSRYRKRLVFDTKRASDDFHAGVFGFKRFIADFVKNLSAEEGETLIEAMNGRNRALVERCKGVVDHADPDDVHTWHKVITLCHKVYEENGAVQPIKRSHHVDAARDALKDYFDASVAVFSMEMKKGGHGHGLPYMEDLLQYVHESLSPRVSRAAYPAKTY